MHYWHVIWLFILAVALAGCNRSGPSNGGFEGTWDIRSRDSGQGPQDSPGLQLVITKEKIVFRAPSGATKTMGDIIKVDPSKTPKEIDLRNGAVVGLGIYALDGNSLSLIVCDPGLPRPTEFRGSPKGMLFKLTRTN